MKVGLSTTVLEPSRTGGRLDGMGVYTQHLFDGLKARGQIVEPLSFPKLGKAGQLSVGQSFGMPFPVAALGGVFSGGFWRQGPKVDIYHSTDYRVLPMRCPVVATLYDAIPMVDPAMANPQFRALKNALMRKLASYADAVIAISTYAVAELVEHYHVDESRIRVIHCGVDSAWLEPLQPAFIDQTLATYGLRPGYFLSVGTLQPRKNVERVVEAHARLPEDIRKQHPLVVVGRPGWRCDELVETLRRKEAVGEVRWLSNVADMFELRALYAAADTFVFPSLYEGFGLPVLEAFASGVSVVTSNTTSLPEVSMGIAYEVDPTSVDAIAEAIFQSVTGVDRQHRVDAGRVRARSLSWDAMVDQTLALYRELV